MGPLGQVQEQGSSRDPQLSSPGTVGQRLVLFPMNIGQESGTLLWLISCWQNVDDQCAELIFESGVTENGAEDKEEQCCSQSW